MELLRVQCGRHESVDCESKVVEECERVLPASSFNST